jgi:hypothetical protein
VRGPIRESDLADRPPHPNPLPASGAREFARRASRIQLSNSKLQIRVRIPATPCARVLQPTSPKEIRGREERRVPAAPVASCAKVESTRVSTADTPEHPAFPHAMVLTVSFALSLVTGLVCHHRRRNEAPLRARLGKGAIRRLDASVGASGPHDFAVRQPHHSSARRLIAHRP